MIARTIRIVVFLAVVVVLIVDLISPLAFRLPARSAARHAASAGAVSLLHRPGDSQAALQAATAAATAKNAHLVAFSFSSGRVRVTVSRHAWSILADRVFSSYYQVKESASATASAPASQ